MYLNFLKCIYKSINILPQFSVQSLFNKMIQNKNGEKKKKAAVYFLLEKKKKKLLQYENVFTFFKGNSFNVSEMDFSIFTYIYFKTINVQV